MDVTPIAGDHASLLQAGLDHIAQGISVFDRDLRLVGWNRRFIELIDLPPAMVCMGAAFECFIRYNAERGEYGPGTVEELVADRVRAARTFVPHYLERTRPNGVVLAVQGAPLGGGGFVTVYTNITERRRAEALIREHALELEARVSLRTAELAAVNAELRDSLAQLQATAHALATAEERLRLITDAIPASIAYIDRQASIGFANRQFAGLWALTSDEVIGRSLESVLDSALFRDLSPHLAQAFAGVTATFDYTCGRPGGETSTTHNVLVPEMDERGRAVGIFVLSLDITAAKRAEAALRDAQKMAAMGQLAGGLAHDFNNLLTVIIGSLGSLKRHVDADLAERHVEPAIRAGQRGVDITRRLLAFARRQPLDPRPVDVEQIVTRTAGLLRASLPGSIAITCATDGTPWRALADPDQLEDALINLALNGRDAMPHGGTLAVHVANRLFGEGSLYADQPVVGAFVEITVSDSGTGIDPATLSRAFEPFFTTKPFGVGSGLGLSMVYGFVKQSGGHIRITSEVGVGTRVSLLLPRAESPAPGAAVHRARPRRRGELALLVEPDVDARIAMRRELLEQGYNVIEAREDAEAEGLLRAIPDIQLLVAGASVPGCLDGRALAARARAARPDIAIALADGLGDSTAGATPSRNDVARARGAVGRAAIMRAIGDGPCASAPTGG